MTHTLAPGKPEGLGPASFLKRLMAKILEIAFPKTVLYMDRRGYSRGYTAGHQTGHEAGYWQARENEGAELKHLKAVTPGYLAAVEAQNRLTLYLREEWGPAVERLAMTGQSSEDVAIVLLKQMRHGNSSGA
jgi:hypothetical protein